MLSSYHQVQSATVYIIIIIIIIIVWIKYETHIISHYQCYHYHAGQWSDYNHQCYNSEPYDYQSSCSIKVRLQVQGELSVKGEAASQPRGVVSIIIIIIINIFIITVVIIVVLIVIIVVVFNISIIFVSSDKQIHKNINLSWGPWSQ